MNNVLFAFGPAGRYLFNAPAQWALSKLPNELQQLFNNKCVADVRWASFGEQEDSYFVVYDAKGDHGSGTKICYGDGLPSALLEWLRDGSSNISRSEACKVVLGAGQSFFAWDTDSVRWSGVAPGLERVVQSWLSPAGWKSGPPRIVALGPKDDFIIVSEYGAMSYEFSSEHWVLQNTIKDIRNTSNFSWGLVQNIFMNPSDAKHIVVVTESTFCHGNVHDFEGDDLAARKAYRDVAESFASDEIKAYYHQSWKEAEEAEQRKREEQERQRRAKAEEQRKRQSDADAQRKKEELREQLQLAYVLWKSKCDALFAVADRTPIALFPHFPTEHCGCKLASCLIRKKEKGLLACRHDVENLLRASGQYSLKWLRTERLAWHPDRFGRKCSVDKKDALSKKASELYTIYEELISSEQAAAG